MRYKWLIYRVLGGYLERFCYEWDKWTIFGADLLITALYL